ncbi:hypothetical protein LSCM1_07896 [Leishmania martiniquensis]|uniref:Uncharacterized protein n=1 Tax=Leishmania martiniquensis TaxID=1580590 RepID=A0A836KRT1_9TRYP|nr:hypothetical protein LSCM1_07896 [Leishmania martiniquensis]
MMSVDRCAGDDPAETAVKSPPPHPWYHSPSQSASSACVNDAYRRSHSMRDSSKTNGSPEPVFVPRLGASRDLPSSVTHFLSLSSASSSAAAKELRRQMLVVRDYCVGLSNRIKGKELLSQGGRHISRKVEATADFNSCLYVIFATSLVFTGETEDDAKDTLRSILGKLKAAQESGDEKVFRAATVEVVNRILLCTPLRPPACDAVRKSGGVKRRPNAEQQLRDECLDFLSAEDGIPVLREGVWQRWLNFFETGYIRYVEQLLEEQQRAAEAPAAAGAASGTDDDDEAAHNGEAAPAFAAPALLGVPFFTSWHSYWTSPPSAYAQFCHLLLAIFFVRTRDFSLNYLARVTRLVHCYSYQLEFEDGHPIPVKVGGGEADDDVVNEEAAEPAQREEEEERSLPMPEFDSGVTRRTLMSISLSAERGRSPADEGHERLSKPRRRCHKCFTTEELPEELRPSADAVKEEEVTVTKDAQEEHSHVPAVRHTDKMELLDVSASRQRERE